MNVIFNGQPYELVRVSGDLALIRSWGTVLCVSVRDLTEEPPKPAEPKKKRQQKA